ncbi:MAG: hypothetical protein ACM3SQ_00615 [Betaproteobacteria bacterium]
MARLVRRLLPLALLLAPALVHAQAAAENVWARGTELGVVAGAATNAAATGPVLGGTAGWEVTRWFAVEGRGSWFWRGSGAEGFGADIGALVNVIPKQRATPFVTAAFGLYRASFDSPAAMVPAFYGRRMGSPGSPVRAGHYSFTDPALRLGGGIDLIVRRYFSLRPEVSVLLIRRGGAGTTLTTFGARLAYRFEDHPVTPNTR